jgi:hypothetical protein
MAISGLVLILSGWLSVAGAPAQVDVLTTAPMGDWIPRDTAVVVEVTNAGQWSEDFGNNQLGQMLIRFSPANRFIRGWRRMQRMLDQTNAQMVDNYFGKSVVLLAAHTNPTSPMVIVSKLADRQTALDLIKKLELEEREVYADHHIYQTPDGGAILSLHDTTPTIILTSERNTPYLKRLIDAPKNEALLKDDASFKQFLTSSPADSVLKGYIRSDDNQQKHTFFVTQTAQGLTGQYVGNMPQIASVLSQLGATEPHHFGPLPPDCMAAMSVNLSHLHPQTIAVFDKIMAPKSFATDIQPKLGQSMVVYLNKPAQPQMLPAVGLAIQMKNTDLASDMDTFMKNIMVVTSMSLEKRRPPHPDAQAPPPPVQPILVTHNKTAYRTAPVANLKMVQQGMTMVTPIQLSWGSINDWYVICSDKETFCQSIDHPDNKSSLIQPAADVKTQASVPGVSVAQLQFKPQVLIEHLKRFVDPEKSEMVPPDEGRRFYRYRPIRIEDVCDALEHIQSVQINIYRDDKQQMITQVQLVKQ